MRPLRPLGGTTTNGLAGRETGMALENVDAGLWADWVWKAGTVLVALIYVPIKSRLDELDKGIRKVDSDQDDIRRRLISLETKMEGALVHRDLDDIEKRLATVETRMEGAPNHDDLGKIHDKINQVAKELAELCGSYSQTSQSQSGMMKLILQAVREKA
jgi:predicted  nucleic acid-binding Zn-ribbon protein